MKRRRAGKGRREVKLKVTERVQRRVLTVSLLPLRTLAALPHARFRHAVPFLCVYPPSLFRVGRQVGLLLRAPAAGKLAVFAPRAGVMDARGGEEAR